MLREKGFKFVQPMFEIRRVLKAVPFILIGIIFILLARFLQRIGLSFGLDHANAGIIFTVSKKDRTSKPCNLR